MNRNPAIQVIVLPRCDDYTITIGYRIGGINGCAEIDACSITQRYNASRKSLSIASSQDARLQPVEPPRT